MRYPLSSPDSMSPAAVDAAIDSLRSGQYTMGAHVAQFERDFAAYVGSKHAIMVNSGSSANLAAVEALMRPSSGEPEWKAGDEVLVPALAWPTTVWPLVQLGLVPVFVDSDPQTLAMNPTHAYQMCRTRTKGAMLIHVLGCPADVVIGEMPVIEDCCESFGARIGRRHVGMSGIMGTFSHFFAHQLTTMEGGTITTNDDAIADDLRSIRAHGWTRNRSDRKFFEAKANIDPRFLFVTTGYNLRPLDLQGAAGVAQLRSVDASLAARRDTAAALRAELASIPWLRIPGAADVAWMNLPIILRNDAPLTRGEVVRAFEEAGIETRPILAGNLLRHPVMARVHHRADAVYPVADKIMRDGFMMGCHSAPSLAAECMRDACQALRRAA